MAKQQTVEKKSIFIDINKIIKAYNEKELARLKEENEDKAKELKIDVSELVFPPVGYKEMDREALSKMTGIHYQKLSQYQNCKVPLKIIKNLLKFMEISGLSLEEIIGEKSE